MYLDFKSLLGIFLYKFTCTIKDTKKDTLMTHPDDAL